MFSILLALEFDMYLVDEGMPVTADVQFNKLAQEVLRERLKNATIIIVSHDEKILKRYCNQAAVLQDGKLYYFSTLEEAKSLYDYTHES